MATWKYACSVLANRYLRVCIISDKQKYFFLQNIFKIDRIPPLQATGTKADKGEGLCPFSLTDT